MKLEEELMQYILAKQRLMPKNYIFLNYHQIIKN